jgi:hypothetical protein
MLLDDAIEITITGLGYTKCAVFTANEYKSDKLISIISSLVNEFMADVDNYRQTSQFKY